tara:strand:- start:942 stop:1313 length:372 start_codon:yes stop_codon:yes gene_type:complete
MSFAVGKKAKAISDRSGMAFPYTEMVKEWNGSFVHKSEFEPKHPQLEPRKHKPDAEALRNARPPVKLEPSAQIENGVVSTLMASIGVTEGKKFVGTFTSANATPLVSALTLTASLGTESVSAS